MNEYLEPCKTLASQTGEILLKYWNQAHLQTFRKSDGTPCTEADLAAHKVIAEGLAKLTPEIPILSEEGELIDFSQRSQWQVYWLIDPLDGTRGFLAHLEQFSVNIALIQNHRPVFGVIYVPAARTFYYACQGEGAFKQLGQNTPQRLAIASKEAASPWRIVVGQYSQAKRISQLIKDSCAFEILHVNGSVKFGWLAEGQADFYPRFGPICEWDIAAGDCILHESGGVMVDLHGRTLQYNCQDSLLSPEFIALADPRWQEHWLRLINE